MDNPLVQVDPGLFIWTIVTFLVLVTLLGIIVVFAIFNNGVGSLVSRVNSTLTAIAD